MKTVTRRLIALCLLAVVLTAAGCGGPEQKKMKFYNKGKALYEKGDYVKAELEFKNALQIDPIFPDAYHMQGLVSLRKGNLRNAYGNFMKATELDPENLKAQLELGKVMLMGGMGDFRLQKEMAGSIYGMFPRMFLHLLI